MTDERVLGVEAWEPVIEFRPQEACCNKTGFHTPDFVQTNAVLMMFYDGLTLP